MMLYGKYSLEPHEGADPGLRGAATGGLPSNPPRSWPMRPAISLRPKRGGRLRVDRRPA